METKKGFSATSMGFGFGVWVHPIESNPFPQGSRKANNWGKAWERGNQKFQRQQAKIMAEIEEMTA